ncbi:hypothetical protein [Arenibacter palladensis]|uniref:hypothetical protein n=1 Tax=Arenibacter palladensis TaxID=237373 RepID=UPI0026E3F1CC|nr:hypothetical protein [Arenibacter palladensis]MDO6605714.1 hypothetical protein [Arenibacter palladensis]
MRLLYLFPLLLVLFSCNESKKDKASAINEVLEDFSKMPDSIFNAGFELLNSIDNESFPEVMELLRNNINVTEIGAGENLISFRVQHGPLMVMSFGDSSPGTKGFSATSMSSVATLPTWLENETPNVVANKRKNRQNKKALLLAPYYWEFAEYDDPLVPLEKLKGKRNYKGGITFKANETNMAQKISLEDYASFNDYDIVHVSAHGSRTCVLKKDEIEIVRDGDSNMCYTFISSGVHYNFNNLKQVKKQISDKGYQGIYFAKSDIPGIGKFFIGPEFFRHQYTNLESKLVILSACELGQRNDLKNTFEDLMLNGQMFYWQNSVFPDDAFNAFAAMYERLLLYGETIPIAFENIPDNLKNNVPSTFKIGPIGKRDTIRTYTYLRMINQGNAMHIIEPIGFMDEKTKKELQEGTVYPFEGILEDDEPEEASFTMEFLGYTVQEMEDKGMTFSLKVDGNTVLDHISFVPDTDPNDDIEVKGGKNEKTTLVTFKSVNLKKDLKKNSSVKLEALFHFSEENYGYQMIHVSTGSSDMRIVMKGPDGTINMFFDADNYALKMTHPAENATLYSDEEGFIYMNVPGQGWIKTKMGQMAAMIANVVPMNMDFLALEPTKGSVMHKIAAFAGDITIAKLENEPRAKKLSGGIGSEKTVFIADGRVTITFDDKKRLESLVELPSSIRYYYEEQEITIPNAQIFSMPSFQ